MRRLVALLGLAAALAAAAPDDFRALMARGRAALDARDYGAARVALERAVALRPEDPEAHFTLSRAYGGERQYQPAIRHLEETLRLVPGHTGALIDLAAIEAYSGRLDRAEARYREAIAKRPDPRARRGLAVVMARAGRAGEGIELLEAILAADPADLESRYELGVLLMQQGDCAGAIDHLEAVVRAQPDHRGALHNLAGCLARAGRSAEAAGTLERFRAVARADRERTERERSGYFLMIEIDTLLEKGDLKGALAKAAEAVATNPDDARLHALQGQCLDLAGDDAGALAAYRRAADRAPHDPLVAVEVGRLLAKGGRLDEAARWLEKAATNDPLMPEPHYLLALVYDGLGRPREAAASRETWRRLENRRRINP